MVVNSVYVNLATSFVQSAMEDCLLSVRSASVLTIICLTRLHVLSAVQCSFLNKKVTGSVFLVFTIVSTVKVNPKVNVFNA